MKVLIIGPDIEKSKGGMATVIRGIYENLSQNKNLTINLFPSYIDGNKLTVMFYSFYATFKFLLFYRNYDIYHIHCASYGSTYRKGIYIYLAKFFNKKVILHIHGAEYLSFYEKSRNKNLIRKIISKADLVIALSDYWKEKFEKIFNIENCVVLVNGVDPSKFTECCGITEKNYVITMFGRLGDRKGTYDLIDSIDLIKEKIPNLICNLAGDGDIEKCNSLITQRKLNKNVNVMGWIDFNKKISLLKSTNIVVLPSYNEGLPMSLLEGMASGKAIISTRVGAIPELINKENGILINPGDKEGLADAILFLCENIEVVKKMGIANRIKIENYYNVNKIYKCLLNYYDNLK